MTNTLQEFIEEAMKEVMKEDWFSALWSNVDEALTGNCLYSFKSHLRACAERTAAAVAIEKKEEDCAQNPDYPQDQCTPTCGHNHAVYIQKVKASKWLGK